ncbi:Protein TIC 214 [Frankliniella fusca]|uniref:Protein TIC 214 n=1 Tax=Frankliniella fusca TaxID=407009 RepID=A0AAE1L9T3_9NEOP|nr:Protein TIC 214 [Frankliniella fusca]
MNPGDERPSKRAKILRNRYLEEADEDGIGYLSNFSLAHNPSAFSLDPVSLGTLHPTSFVGLCTSSSESAFVTKTSEHTYTGASMLPNVQGAVLDHSIFPGGNIHAGPVCLPTLHGAVYDTHTPLMVGLYSDIKESTASLPSLEIGDLPWDTVSHQFEEPPSQNFQRFAVEDLNDLILEDSAGPNVPEACLYEGAPISPIESVTAILSFMQSEHISNAGLERLLSLISLHLPTPNNFFKSSCELFKLLEGHEKPMNISYYCSMCLKELSSSSVCDSCTDGARSVCLFIHVPLEPQIQRMFKRPHFQEDINYKATRTKQNNDNIEDIYDGVAYKKAEQQFSDGDFNLTLTWNTDGLQVFKSSLMSLWPFYFVINELSPKKRFLTENMLMGGIWCGVTKPHPNLSLKHICHDLKKLENGITTQENAVCKVFVKVLCGTCDAPARAYFLNMKTHSGFYSCHLCLCRGENSIDSGDVTVFPFESNFAPRTLEQYKDNVNFAVLNKVLYNKQLQNDNRCCGIKGPSLLSFIVDDLFSSTSIDSMHCVFLGVTRQLLTLWFDKLYKDEQFSLFSKIKTVNERILAIEPPHFLDRLPDTVDKLVHWKASMFRAFLFHFSLCVLRGILASDYFEHFILLVSGVAMLNSNSISQEDIQIANSLLTSFVQKFEILYGKRHMSHNLHMLLHLGQNVNYLAPLWVTNCFKFEDFNGRLLKLVHGTRHPGLQVLSNLSLVTHLPWLVDNLENSAVQSFCKLLSHKLQLRAAYKIADNVFCIGDAKPLSSKDHWMLSEISQVTMKPTLESVHVFERLYKDGILYVSDNYKKTQRVSSYIKYLFHNSLEIGNIVTFIKLPATSEYFALVKRLQYSAAFPTWNGPRHLYQIHSPHLCIDVVPVCYLQTVLFKVQVSDTLYVSEPINNFELE